MAWSAATQAAATEAAHTGMQSGTCVAYQRNKSGRCSRGTCSHGPSGHAPYPTLTHLHFHTTVRVVVKAPRSTTTHGRVHPLPPPPLHPPHRRSTQRRRWGGRANRQTSTRGSSTSVMSCCRSRAVSSLSHFSFWLLMKLQAEGGGGGATRRGTGGSRGATSRWHSHNMSRQRTAVLHVPLGCVLHWPHSYPSGTHTHPCT